MDLPVFTKFEVKRILAHKANFTLYDARDRRNGTALHLKVLNRTLAQNESSVYSFLNGARIIKHLNHPNICKIADFGNDEKGGYYFASEPIQSEPLTALILDKFSLAQDDLIEIFVTIGSTLRHAHLHGLVHGMLNPNSIYIKPDGAIKIDDFGFSWYIPAILQQNDANSLQLARYIAPDFYQDANNVDGRADIYSLGLMLHEILACGNPIAGNTIASIQSQHMAGNLPPIDLEALGLPQGLQDIIEGCTTVERDLRFQNLREYLNAFEKLTKPGLPQIGVSENEPVLSLKMNSSHTEKHFDESWITEYEAELKENAGSFANKKFAFTGLGALLLVVLVLFVTNYIPLPFIEDKGITEEEFAEIARAKSALAGYPETSVPALDSGESNNTEEPTDKTATAELESSLLANNKPDSPTSGDENGGKEQQEVTQAALTESRQQATIRPQTTVSRKPPEKKPKPQKEITRTPVVSQKAESRPAPATSLQAQARTVDVDFIVTADDDPLVANVFINKRFAGKTNAEGGLKIEKLAVDKSYSIRVAQQGYTSLTKEITVDESNSPVSIELKSKKDIFGTILIDAVPRADEIYIDGVRHKGVTPTRVSLKHGAHKIKLVNSQLNATWEQKVDLKISQILRVRHDFTKKEFGQVAISLKNAAQYGFGFVYVDGKKWHEKHNTTPLQLKLTVGAHSIELKRDGFNSIPKDVIVQVEKGQTKHVAFTFTQVKKGK